MEKLKHPTEDDVAKQLTAMAVIYEKDLSPEVLELMMEDLSGFHPGTILRALRLCRLELTRFPSIAEIIKRTQVKTEAGQAQEIIGKIFDAISCHGYMKPDAARLKIGTIGWRAVMNFGGWKRVCDFPYDQQGVLRSQLLNAINTAVNDNVRDQMIESKPTQPDEPLEFTGMRKVGFDFGLGPDDPA